MKTSEKTDKLIEALFLFNKNFVQPVKDERVQGRGYKYLSLDGLLAAIRPQLLDVGLLLIQPLQDNTVVTRLYHSSGQWIESVKPIPKLQQSNLGNDAQQEGAAITYTRRYAITSLLGISTDDDTDGSLPTGGSKQTSNTNGRSNTPRKRPTPPPPKPRQPSEAQKGKLRQELAKLRQIDEEAATAIEGEIKKHHENKIWNSKLCSSYIDKVMEQYNESFKTFK